MARPSDGSALPLISGRIDRAAMRFRYCGFGLEIASDFAIPGAVDSADGTTAPELKIVHDSIGLDSSAVEHSPYRLHGDRLELAVPGVASYLLDRPDRLVVSPAAEASAVDVSALLIASGIPMALWACGGLVLHASGVVLPGCAQAVAIAGASGSGKSALARALVESGAKLLGDDALWLREVAGAIVGSGLSGGIFGQSAGPAERPFWPVGAPARASTAPLGAIAILDPSAPASAPQRLRGVEALGAVLRHRHRPRIPALLGLEAERLALTALLCARVPVYALGTASATLAEQIEHIGGLPLAGR